MVHSHIIAGETCWLVQPVHVGAKWTKDNLHFRSSVWNSQGELISASFPKFFNWDEKPDIYPVPKDLGNCDILDKLDGSTLIISLYKGELIVRTRGTVDATKLDNGHEIEALKKKYPLVFDSKSLQDGFSYIYEWTSPTNQIVLNYGEEPGIYLTAIIRHGDYSLFKQIALDLVAVGLKVRRPLRYSFASIEDMIKTVDCLKGKEGVCVYYNNDQSIRKVKSAEYLAAHKMKSELGSIDKVIDLWFILNRPSYQEFEQYINSKFDFEIFTLCRGYVSQICDGWKEVEKILQGMESFVAPLKFLSRKEAAEKILQAYGQTNRSGMAFSILSDKELKTDDYKKLLYQVLKK